MTPQGTIDAGVEPINLELVDAWDNKADMEAAFEAAKEANKTEQFEREMVVMYKTNNDFASRVDEWTQPNEEGVIEAAEPVSTENPQAGEPAPEAPPAAPAEPTKTTIKTDGPIEYDPSWLGTYGTENGQSIPVERAIKRMFDGKVEADRRIGFLQDKRIPALEQTVNDTTSKLTMAEQENAKLKQTIEELQNAKATPAPAEPEATETQEPVVPGRPKLPTGDDALDDAKIEKYNNDIIEYEKAVQNHTRWATDKAVRESVSKVTQQYEEKITGLTEQVSQIQSTPTTSSAQAAPQGDPFAEYNAFVADDAVKVVFPGLDNVGTAQSEWLGWLKNIAVNQGIQGDVLDENGSVRPEINRLSERYYSDQSEAGNILRNQINTSGLTPPSSMNSLLKLYEVRDIQAQHNFGTIREALNWAQYSNPERFGAPAQPAAPAQPQAQAPATPPPAQPAQPQGPLFDPMTGLPLAGKEDAAAQARAHANRQGHASEVLPGATGTGGEQDPGNMPDMMNEYNRITTIPHDLWSDHDIMTIQAISDKSPDLQMWLTWPEKIKDPQGRNHL